MPRTARIVIPGIAHHITQRGNAGQPVFFDDEDRTEYLELLHTHCEKFHLRVIGYCLMTNHIHIVAVPRLESSLAEAIGRTHQLYTNFLHDKLKKSGHLWQSRFYSCPMDEEHTINALAYVETNPVRAGMIAHARDYPWSSAAAHVIEKPDQLIDLRRWFSRFDNKEWERTLDEYHGRRAMSDTIRRHTRKGAPLGRDRAFLNAVKAWQGTDTPRDANPLG